MRFEEPPQALLDNRSDPFARAVLSDWYLERGMHATPIGVAIDLISAAAAAAAAALSVNQSLTQLLKGDTELRTGLTQFQVTGAYYGRAVTLVGWLRRVGGDEYELKRGHVTVVRTGPYHPNGLDRLANEGPGKNYQCSEPSKGTELIHRLLMRRPKPADEKAWAKILPRPKDWQEEASRG